MRPPLGLVGWVSLGREPAANAGAPHEAKYYMTRMLAATARDLPSLERQIGTHPGVVVEHRSLAGGDPAAETKYYIDPNPRPALLPAPSRSLTAWQDTIYFPGAIPALRGG